MFLNNKPKWQVLVLSGLIAFFLHICGLYLLQGLHFQYKNPQKISLSPLDKQDLQNRLLVKQNNQELANIFSRLNNPYIFDNTKYLVEKIDITSLLKQITNTIEIPSTILQDQPVIYPIIACDKIFSHAIIDDEDDYLYYIEGLNDLTSKEYPLAYQVHALDNLTDNYIQPLGENFEIFTSCLPKQAGEGYYFQISFSPQTDQILPALKKHVSFLIDCSNASKDYCKISKKAVYQAIATLQATDSYSIAICDERNLYCSEAYYKNDKRSPALTKTFLKNQRHGRKITSSNLFAHLNKIIPQPIPNDTITIAIFLFNGNIDLSKDEQRMQLKTWTDDNQGRLSLFSITTKDNKHVPLLDLFSVFNKGSLLIASDIKDIESKLLQLMNAVSTPILKDLSISLITNDKEASITSYPSLKYAPDFFEKNGYTILGTTNKACQFTLFIQGQGDDGWVDIKKTITLKENISSVVDTLEKSVSLQQAYAKYESFIETGNQSDIQSVKNLLEPMNIPIAF